MSKLSRPIFLVALALLASAESAMGQQTRRAALPDSASALPTLSIGGRVTIQELRVGSDPRVEVNLTACPLLEQIRVDDRSNLPNPVVAGVYRDVVVEAHAGVVLADGLDTGQCAGAAAPDSVPEAAAPR